MCLNLPYAEALLWRENALALIKSADTAATKMLPDPLLTSLPELSILVSAVDSVKKRHGLLIEQALIFAINKIPHWSARKQKIQTVGGKFEVDCLAFNSSTGDLYVFECKRGHGVLDADAQDSVDRRLERVKVASASYAMDQGWVVKKTEAFIVSFYGKKWSSAFNVFNMHDVATIFPPCVAAFTAEFQRYTESATACRYGPQLKSNPDIQGMRSAAAAEGRLANIFDLLDKDEHRGRTIRFTVDGWTTVAE